MLTPVLKGFRDDSARVEEGSHIVWNLIENPGLHSNDSISLESEAAGDDDLRTKCRPVLRVCLQADRGEDGVTDFDDVTDERRHLRLIKALCPLLADDVSALYERAFVQE